ncbi:hypothetical protein AALA83_15345 [Oscillospiraceae bacterium 44-5]
MNRMFGFLFTVCLLLTSACGGPISGQNTPPENPPAQSTAPAPVPDASPNVEDDILRAENSHTFLNYPVVYMTTDISPEGLMKVYQELEASPSGNVAVKLSIGEPGSNYLRPELIGELVHE